MNKLIISTVIACGLLVLGTPEAAAHEQRVSRQRLTSHDYYERDSFRHDYFAAWQRRSSKMPRWLKRNKSFRHWFKQSRLQRNRRLSWNQLFEIYQWEHSWYRYSRY
jgi:hypothetical protein